MEPANVTPGLFDFSVFGWPWTGLVTLLALLVYVAFSLKVARARHKYKVLAPAMDGPPEFLKAVRIHLNTLEQLVIFVPLVWMAALSTNDAIAAAIGVIWPISRVIYAVGYSATEPKMRQPGFILGFVVIMVLFGLTAFELGHALFFWHDEGAAVGMN